MSTAEQPAPQRVISYIDGFNLYFGMLSKGWRKYMWLDVVRLSKELIGHNQVLRSARYFTARVTFPPDKADRQDTYLQALGTLQNEITITLGKYQSASVSCRRCGHSYTAYNEKMTDVNIAVSLFEDAVQDRFDTAFVVSGDSDLCPAIDAVKRLFPQKSIVVAFPPGRSSISLKSSATTSFVIGEGKLRASQLPEEVTAPNGYVLKRPGTWI